MKATQGHLKLLMSALVFVLASGASAHKKNPPDTAQFVDLQKYAGKWYEVAGIPQSFQKQCTGNTTAEYSLLSSGLVKVVNSCDTKTGKKSVAEARARVVDRKSNSKLEVTFVKIIKWIWAFSGNYWILDVKPDYSLALIGDPTRKFGWILSRNPDVSTEDLVYAKGVFERNGYDSCKVLTSPQSGGLEERIPLCQFN